MKERKIWKYEEAKKRVFMLLEEKGLTQKALADELGVSPSTINKWLDTTNEKQKHSFISLQYLPHVAKFLGCTTDYILTGQDSIFADENQKELSVRETCAIINKLICLAPWVRLHVEQNEGLPNANIVRNIAHLVFDPYLLVPFSESLSSEDMSIANEVSSFFQTIDSLHSLLDQGGIDYDIYQLAIRTKLNKLGDC